MPENKLAYAIDAYEMAAYIRSIEQRREQAMTSEFSHYPGCKGRDPDNCSGCALTDTRQDAPNYSAWPLAYMENGRAIPAKWRDAFKAEMARTDNPAYAANVKATMERRGVKFTDGKGL